MWMDIIQYTEGLNRTKTKKEESWICESQSFLSSLDTFYYMEVLNFSNS